MPIFTEEGTKAQRSDVTCPSHTVDAQEAAEQVLDSGLRDPRAFAFDVTLLGASDAEAALLQAQPKKQLRVALGTPVLWSEGPGGPLASAVPTSWANGHNHNSSSC